MSDFVNYKKRSVTLPGACKDLIDVLNPHDQPQLTGKIDVNAISPDERLTVSRRESVTGGPSEIKKYVTMVFESRARSFTLMVTPPDERITIEVDRVEDGEILASVVVQTGTAQESGVRSFFAQHGLRSPEDSGMPPMFIPSLPVQLTCEISPLPSDAQLLATLVAELLRDVAAVSDDSQLCFRYYEVTDAA
jgi:hypothetical protein